TEQFWLAAKDGNLMIGHCNSCGEKHYYPRGMCPHCGSAEVELIQSSGKGEIYSWSVLRRADPPFAIAYVTLDEGPTMMTNIIECDLDNLHIGQRVELKFSPTEEKDGPPVPTFKPI
ncbi:MAG: Zn-ribbon domain-containing OB-fold protein, partial [Rhodospirillaceae bacterium]|nr:Zn-ribbon domain-containing OB-fold protein [Rhodospirillaceae bacterium]